MLSGKVHTIVLLVTLLSLPVKVNGEESGMLRRYDFSRQPSRVLVLPSSLRELSGIAVTDDGRLFAHDDEVSTLYQLDPADGRVLKTFHAVIDHWFGKGKIEDDFEDMAIAGRRFFLVTSKGTLYEFSEGREGERVDARVIKTGLGKNHEVEGLCYDPSDRTLLISCKSWSVHGTKQKVRPVFAFSITTMSLLRQPRFLIDAGKVAEKAGSAGFHPSAMARSPFSGNYFVLSAKSRIIAELHSADGSLLGVSKLQPSVHPQPESMSFLPDKTLLIGDEGDFRGKISVYRVKK